MPSDGLIGALLWVEIGTQVIGWIGSSVAVYLGGCTAKGKLVKAI